MYFHSVHGKNIQLSSDNSQAKRVSSFCQGITFSNSSLSQFQIVTFLVGCDSLNKLNNFNANYKKKSYWNGHLRIGLTTINPITLTLSDLPEFTFPTLLNTENFWIAPIKASYLKHGNKISIVLDKNNSLQLSVNYIVKTRLFSGMIPSSQSTKLWLILDLYGNTNLVRFLPSGLN